MQPCNSNLKQVEDLLAQIQLKVCVVGAGHVVDEHQAIPLGLKAAGNKRVRFCHRGFRLQLLFYYSFSTLLLLLF